MHKCVSNVVLRLPFSKNLKIQEAKDNIIYLEWHVLWVEAKEKRKKHLAKLCRSIKNFLKSFLANGCLFNFHPYNKLFCRFCLFWGNISLFFPRHEVWMMQNSIWICKLNYLHNVLLISEYKFWSLRNWNQVPQTLKIEMKKSRALPFGGIMYTFAFRLKGGGVTPTELPE